MAHNSNRGTNQPDLDLRKTVILLREKGNTFAQIAKMLGTTRQNVHKLYQKAINSKA
jgi:transcriptional regulator